MPGAELDPMAWLALYHAAQSAARDLSAISIQAYRNLSIDPAASLQYHRAEHQKSRVGARQALTGPRKSGKSGGKYRTTSKADEDAAVKNAMAARLGAQRAVAGEQGWKFAPVPHLDHRPTNKLWQWPKDVPLHKAFARGVTFDEFVVAPSGIGITSQETS